MLEIREITSEAAEIIYDIQQKSFIPLLNVYHDYNMNPAMESVYTIKEKIDRDNTIAYIFKFNDMNIGWVRLTYLESDICKISGLCVIPEYQNRGIAQEALKILEEKHNKILKWVLDTIYEEKGNCHLYEKLGYVKVGEIKKVNENMSIINYEKYIN